MDPASLFGWHPIFPPIPSTPFIDDLLLPSDIICAGSSDEDEDYECAQSLRIQEKAERYLRGTGDLYIHSAALRGPVVVNPWRKKTKKKKAAVGAAGGTAPERAGTSRGAAKDACKILSYFPARKSGESSSNAKTVERHVPPNTKANPREHTSDYVKNSATASPMLVDKAKSRFRRDENTESPVGVEVAVRWIGRREASSRRPSPPQPEPEPEPEAPLLGTQCRTASLPPPEAPPTETQKRKRTLHSPTEESRHVSNPILTQKPHSEVDRTKKRPKIDFAALSPVVAASDRARSRKRRKGTTPPLGTRGAGEEKARNGKSAPPSIAQEKSAGREMREKSATELSATRAPEKEKPEGGEEVGDKPRMQDTPRGAGPAVRGEELRVLDTPMPQPSLALERSHSRIQEADDIRSQTVNKYISDMSFPEDETPRASVPNPTSTTKQPKLLQTPHIRSTNTSFSTEKKVSPVQTEPETPWQGTQAHLLAARNGFFNALADSPIIFDSDYSTQKTARTSSTRRQQTTTNSITSLSEMETPLPAQTPDISWGIIQPPFPTGVKPPQSHPTHLPALPPLSFTPAIPNPEQTSPANSVGSGFILTDYTELTPFRAFATPTASPIDTRKPTTTSPTGLKGILKATGGGYSSSSPPPPPLSFSPRKPTQQRFLHFAPHMSSPAPAATALAETSMNPVLFASTQSEDPTQLEVSMVRLPQSTEVSMHAQQQQQQHSLTFEASSIPNGDSMGFVSGMGKQGQGFDYQDEHADGTSPEKIDDVAEMMGIMGGGRWDIDEELKKMVGASGTPTASGRRKVGRKRSAW